METKVRISMDDWGFPEFRVSFRDTSTSSTFIYRPTRPAGHGEAVGIFGNYGNLSPMDEGRKATIIEACRPYRQEYNERGHSMNPSTFVAWTE